MNEYFFSMSQQLLYYLKYHKLKRFELPEKNIQPTKFQYTILLRELRLREMMIKWAFKISLRLYTIALYQLTYSKCAKKLTVTYRRMYGRTHGQKSA